MIAWAVKFGRGLVALFLDHARAEKYAADSHGIIVELTGEEQPNEPPAPDADPEPDRT